MLASATAVTALDTGGKTIPTMTDFTTPSGEASASSTDGTAYAWQAYDGVVANVWQTKTDLANAWLRYSFPNKTFVYKAKYYFWGATYTPKNYKLQYSNDGTVWEDAKTGVFSDAAGWVELSCEKSTAAYHWRLRMYDNYGGTHIIVQECEMYGREFV